MKTKKNIFYMGKSCCESYNMIEDDFSYYVGLYVTKSSAKSMGAIIVKGRRVRGMLHALDQKIPISLPTGIRILSSF